MYHSFLTLLLDLPHRDCTALSWFSNGVKSHQAWSFFFWRAKISVKMQVAEFWKVRRVGGEHGLRD